MTMSEWARKEVEIACKKENPDGDCGFDYGCACYNSALRAFESLCEDGHSGFSIKMTQGILNRLIDGKPLTPIEDTDDIWSDITDKGENDDYISYQCIRMSSLFKAINSDGSVKYTDVNRLYCINIDTLVTYYSGLVANIIDEMLPITMPYMPGEPIKVYCEEFLTDKNNGDFDTVGVFYALKEEKGEQKRIDINRYFREPFENEKENFHGWVEISKEEYESRKAKKIL